MMSGERTSTEGRVEATRYPGYAIVARLPSRRREIYEAIEERAPWRRVALAVGGVAPIVEALRRLDHPGIVRLIAEHGDAVALSWVRGRRLDRAVDALSGDERLDVAIQAAEIVAHAHACGVVIRDLKPGNLMLDGGRLVLIDLDLAMCDDAAPGDHEGGGTWGWSAPEQAIFDPTQIDLRADLYALGATLYFAFTGEPLFSRGAAGLREQFAEDRFEARADRVPLAVAPIVRTLLQRERAARTTSAAEVAAALRGLRGEEVAVAPVAEIAASMSDGFVAQLAEAVRSPEAPRSADDAARAAAACMRIGDAAAAVAHARAALAIDPRHAGALTWLARAHLAASDHAAAHEVADQLEAALPVDTDDDALSAVLALEITLARPARALALAQRTGRPGALAALADHSAEWLARAAHMAWHERAARAARGHGVVEAGGMQAVRGTALLALARRDASYRAALAACIAELRAAPATHAHGCALDILDRIQRGDDAGAIEALQDALQDGTLDPAGAPVLYQAPLADALAGGAAAVRLCEALLLALVGLEREAAAVELAPLDAARCALATGRRDDALALAAGAPPSEVAARIRALAARDIDALHAAHRAQATWASAYWLCHALVEVGRAPECVEIVDAVWRREGSDELLAAFRAAGLAASGAEPPALGSRAHEQAARALAAQDWESLYQAGAATLALAPDDAEARVELALASLERGEAANALGFARRAVAMRPDSDVAWDLVILAERELGSGDPLATVRAALRVCPASARLHCRLAEALAAAGDDEALAAGERAIQLGPNDRTAWAVHAGLLLDAGRTVDALHIAGSFESACGPGWDVHAIRLRAWLARGEHERAVAAGLAGVAIDAGQPVLWRDLALAWLGLGKLADARNALAVITSCGAADPALAFYLDLAGEAAELIAGRGPTSAAHRDPDLALVAAIARLATDGDAALAALRSLRAARPDDAPGFAARIALAAIAPDLAARIEARLTGRLAGAPRELGWAGALYFLARDRAQAACAIATRALEAAPDDALWLAAAEAAARAGDQSSVARAMAHLGDDPASRLARRLRCASPIHIMQRDERAARGGRNGT